MIFIFQMLFSIQDIHSVLHFPLWATGPNIYWNNFICHMFVSSWKWQEEKNGIWNVRGSFLLS